MRRLHKKFFRKSSNNLKSYLHTSLECAHCFSSLTVILPFIFFHFSNSLLWTCFSVWRWQWLRHYNNNCLPNATRLQAADFEDCSPVIVFLSCLASLFLGAFFNYSIYLIQFQVPPCPRQDKWRQANGLVLPGQHVYSWMNHWTFSNLFSLSFISSVLHLKLNCVEMFWVKCKCLTSLKHKRNGKQTSPELYEN